MKNKRMEKLIRKNKQRNMRSQIGRALSEIGIVEYTFYEGQQQTLIYSYINKRYDSGIMNYLYKLLQLKSEYVFKYNDEIRVIPKKIESSGKVTMNRKLAINEIQNNLNILENNDVLISTEKLSISGPLLLKSEYFNENFNEIMDIFWEHGDLLISDIPSSSQYINWLYIDDTEYFQLSYRVMGFKV